MVPIVLIVFLAAAVGLPAPAHAAQSLNPAQCADTKVKCQKKSNPASNQQQNATTPAEGSACAGFNEIGSSVSCNQNGGGNDGQTAVGNTVNTVVGLLSYVAGILGIIFIILSGFRYITSNGDQNKVASAKTTLVYALVGLAVAALAQILIHTVLSTASSV